MSALRAVLAERFPDPREVKDELHRPIPERPFRRGDIGLLRFEVLLLRVKSGRMP